MFTSILPRMMRLTVLLGISMLARASHFRGGYITWKPMEGTTMIEITYRIGWRRSFSGHFCSASTISSSTMNTGEGTLYCQTCSPRLTIINPISYMCTDFSESEDWTSGENSVLFNYTLADSASFYVGYSSCCWIYLVNGGYSSWSVMTLIDTTQRNRNGVMKINNSPITSMSPLTNLILNCNYTIVIPASDIDGDVIRCRWAVNDGVINECGPSTCLPVPGATLLEEECKLIFQPDTAGYYGVSIQIEDFLSATDTTPLSSIPVQFLIYVVSSSTGCSSIPTFTADTITDGTSVNIKIGTTFHLQIIVNSSTAISEFTTVSPASNLVKTSAERLTPSGTEWYTNVTWTPTAEQAGNHIFCFGAMDVNGVSSEQRCVILSVTAEFPATPYSTEKTTQAEFPTTPYSTEKTTQAEYPTTPYSTEKTTQGFNMNSYPCDPQSGGTYQQCVKLPPYDDFQVTYCISADEVLNRTNNTIRCADSCRAYCYLTCMAEMYGNHSLTEVSRECLCSTSYTTDAETQLPSWCLIPQGNCDYFYNDCIPNRFSSCENLTVLMNALQDQCLWFDDQSLKQECSSKAWTRDVQKCFQKFLMDSVFRSNVTLCSEVTHTFYVQAYEVCFSDSTHDVQFCQLPAAFRSDFNDELVPLIPEHVREEMAISTLLNDMTSC